MSSGIDYEYCTVSLPENILLEVEDIYTERGAEVATGDAILKVTEESYEDTRAELLQQYEDAKTALSQAKLDYKIDALTLLSDYALDSTSGEEVLKLFKKLNDMGHTIVMITHDLHVAESAERTYRPVQPR